MLSRISTVLGLTLFASLAFFLQPHNEIEARQKVENGTGVGQKVIFTDCRLQQQGEGTMQLQRAFHGNRKSRSFAPPMLGGGGLSGEMKKNAGAMLDGVSAAPEAEASRPAPSDSTEKAAPQRPTEQAPIEEYPDRGQTMYLSNDDSMSLSSAQRVEYAIQRFLPIPAEHLRPHEFLNYYRFETDPVRQGEDFSVRASAVPGIRNGEETLAFSVRGRSVSKEERRPATITFVLDQSGSMSGSDKMSYLKRGMHRVFNEFKEGDIINIVQFNHDICTPLEGFQVGRDDPALYNKAIDYLESTGSTNLHKGLTQGYALSEKYYRGQVNNRVLMITDAMANTGVTDEEMMSTVTGYYDKRKIAFSGVGVGSTFNDRLLNKLTEKGKGAYLFLATESAIDKVFGDRFVSLLETVARDVHFKMTLPPSLRMRTFYGEESSERKEDVQAIHYFANSAQLFLSDLERLREPKQQERIEFEVDYEDPRTGLRKQKNFEWTWGDIAKRQSPTIQKARTILAFTDLMGETHPRLHRSWPCKVWTCYYKRYPEQLDPQTGKVATPNKNDKKRVIPPPYPPTPMPNPQPFPTWRYDKEKGRKTCEYYKQEINKLASGIREDGEVEHVLGLVDRYCARFEER